MIYNEIQTGPIYCMYLLISLPGPAVSCKAVMRLLTARSIKPLRTLTPRQINIIMLAPANYLQ